MGRARAAALMTSISLIAGIAHAGGNLAGQNPIEVVVELGRPGQHVFVPSQLRFETGKLYKLVLKNPSTEPHYFTSHGFSQLIFTRKVQVVQEREGKPTTLAEFKGAIREIEVYPGQTAEWWFRPGCNRPGHRLALRYCRQGRQDTRRPRYGGRDCYRVSKLA
jgi:uncharacterized cupredoxin-like copper-binding protein